MRKAHKVTALGRSLITNIIISNRGVARGRIKVLLNNIMDRRGSGGVEPSIYMQYPPMVSRLIPFKAVCVFLFPHSKFSHEYVWLGYMPVQNKILVLIFFPDNLT